MSLGEVDTLNLLSDKLTNLFEESQGYYESFLDANNLYKNGKFTEKEFFQIPVARSPGSHPLP